MRKTMNEITVQSRDLTVGQILNDFYVVPEYQREYVWGKKEVGQMLTDIHDEFDSDIDPKKRAEYFIGSFIVCKRGDGTYELIDGQQRLTTIALLICALRDVLKILVNDHNTDEDFNKCLRDRQIQPDGKYKNRVRIDLQYEDSGDVLKRYIDRHDTHNISLTTTSIRNMVNAYQQMAGFLSSNGYADNADRLEEFHAFMLLKVKMIRIETKDISKALNIFETVNDRGISLTSLDLLKNLLFLHSQKESIGSLAKIWERINNTIFEMKEKPLRVLKYYVMSSFEIDESIGIIRETEVYNWFKAIDKGDKSGYKSDPIGFSKELLEGVETYKLYLDGKDCFNDSSKLMNFRNLGGDSLRQHMILLLAGRILGKQEFDSLAEEVENTLFTMIVSKERSQTIERTFNDLAREIKKCTTIDHLRDFYEEKTKKIRNELSDRFQLEMMKFSTAYPKYQVRYVLGKIEQYFQKYAYGDTDSTKNISNWVDRKLYDLEHIFPQTPSEEAKKEFGLLENPNSCNLIGNVILLEKPINISIGNKPYSSKKEQYLNSTLFTVKCLPDVTTQLTTQKMREVSGMIYSFSNWNEQNILKRQQNLYEMACTVWDIPRLPSS